MLESTFGNFKKGKQENSFTWEGVRRGLEMQFPPFDSLRTANKIWVETLGQAGVWFKE